MATEIMVPLAAVAASEMLASPIDNLTLAQQVTAHVALKALTEACEARVASLKDALTVYVSAKGEAQGDKGTKALTVADSKVSVEVRTASLPDCDGIVALLASKGIDASEATDEVKTLKVNPSKVAYLLSVGKVTEAEVAALRPSYEAMRIYPCKALKAAVAPLKALAGKAEK